MKKPGGAEMAGILVLLVFGLSGGQYEKGGIDLSTLSTSRGWHKEVFPLGFGKGSIFSEDFELGYLPQGWTLMDGNGDMVSWRVTSTFNADDLFGNLPPYHGEYILYYSDDEAGQGSPPTVEGASITVDLPDNLASLFLRFCWGLSQYCETEALMITVEGDTLWNVHSGGRGMKTVELTQYAGLDSISLCFLYDDGNGCWGWAGAFDNIELFEEPPPPSPAVCCFFEQCGPFEAELWIADMAYDNSRGLLYQVEVGREGSNVIIWDPASCEYCKAFDNTTGISQRGIAYNPEEDVIYMGGWNQGILYTFSAPVCGKPLNLIDSCNLSSTDLAPIAGLAWDDDMGGLFVQTNSVVNTMGKVDPSTCTVLWISEEVFYWGGQGFDGAGLAYSPDEHGLYALSLFDHSVNFFLNPESDDCVADTFCYFNNPVTFGWGIGHEDGIPGKFWISRVEAGFLKDYEGGCILSIGVREGRELSPPEVMDILPTVVSDFREVHLTLARGEKVELSLYDGRGRLFESLFLGYLNPGKHVLLLKEGDLPSGVYFLKLRGEKRSLTRKLILLR